MLFRCKIRKYAPVIFTLGCSFYMCVLALILLGQYYGEVQGESETDQDRYGTDVHKDGFRGINIALAVENHQKHFYEEGRKTRRGRFHGSDQMFTVKDISESLNIPKLTNKHSDQMSTKSKYLRRSYEAKDAKINDAIRNEMRINLNFQKVSSQANDMKNNGSLRKWDKSRPIVFLHIAKNGGSSFDKTIFPIVSKLGGRYIGRRHFDWSFIDTIKNPDVVVLLRDPVSRAASHFYFTRKRGTLNTKGNISEYIRNPQNMLETRGIWQDGQAAVSWLTGNHLANWVGIKPNQVPVREIKSLDHKLMCTEAASQLRKTLWFGFLSDQERSFELLQWQLGYSNKIVLAEINKTPHSQISARDHDILQALMPMDIWLYNYAKLLFEARWQQYKTGVYVEPELPPFPDINCKSTRYILACNKKSSLGPLYHVWNTTVEIAKQQMELLPRDEWI